MYIISMMSDAAAVIIKQQAEWWKDYRETQAKNMKKWEKQTPQQKKEDIKMATAWNARSNLGKG
jgi:hypothetical protein